MKQFRRYGVLLLLCLALLPGTAALAQAAETADCNWIYTEDYIVPLGSLSLDDCAATMFGALNQYGLEETYGTWNNIGLYVDTSGEVYSARVTATGGLEWTRAGNINPENVPAAQQPRQPLTLDEIFALVEEDINDFWSLQFEAANARYVKPELVLYDRNRIRTGCGAVTARMGPLYCPADHTAYFPRNFMENEMATVGDFSVVVIIAHEWGHAVQRLTGLNASSPTIFGELQADCFAGAYSRYANLESVKVLLEDGDIEEGATALFLFGDPEGTPWFDEQAHGTGDQRYQSYIKGLNSDYKTCLEIKPDP